MKKVFAILVVAVVLLAIAPAAALAQCGNLRHRHSNLVHTHRACVGDGHKHGRSFWQKHRDKITTAGGALGGAAIGAIAGGGGAAVYTYGIRKRRRSARRY